MPTIRHPLLLNTARLLGGSILFDEAPGFLIRTVEVNNQSGKWVYFPELQQYMPPYTSGNLYLPGGSLRISAILQTPPAMTTVGGDGTVKVVLYDEIVQGPSAVAGSPTLIQSVASNIYTGTVQPPWYWGWIGGTGGANAILTFDAGTLAAYQINKVYVNPSVASTFSIYRTNAAATGGLAAIPINGNPSVPTFGGTILTAPTNLGITFTRKNTPTYGISGASTTSPNVPYPAGIKANDLLFVAFAQSSSGTITGPAGFTQIFSQAVSASATYGLFYKLATGNEVGNIAATSNMNVSWVYPSAVVDISPSTALSPTLGTIISTNLAAATNDSAAPTTETFSALGSSGFGVGIGIYGFGLDVSAAAAPYTTYPTDGTSYLDITHFANPGSEPGFAFYLILSPNSGPPFQTAVARYQNVTWGQSLSFYYVYTILRYNPSPILVPSNFALLGTTASLGAGSVTAIDLAGTTGSVVKVTPGNGIAIVPNGSQFGTLAGVEVAV